MSMVWNLCVLAYNLLLCLFLVQVARRWMRHLRGETARRGWLLLLSAAGLVLIPVLTWLSGLVDLEARVGVAIPTALMAGAVLVVLLVVLRRTLDARSARPDTGDA